MLQITRGYSASQALQKQLNHGAMIIMIRDSSSGPPDGPSKEPQGPTSRIAFEQSGRLLLLFLVPLRVQCSDSPGNSSSEYMAEQKPSNRGGKMLFIACDMLQYDVV